MPVVPYLLLRTVERELPSMNEYHPPENDITLLSLSLNPVLVPVSPNLTVSRFGRQLLNARVAYCVPKVPGKEQFHSSPQPL